MANITRRTFVATTSLFVTGTLLRTRRLAAQRLPNSVLMSGRSAQSLLPEFYSPTALRELATAAVTAAHSAGASYADVRVGERHQLGLTLEGIIPVITIYSTLTYGVRTLVDGAWAFRYGSTPTIDAVTATARDAVATARGYVPFVKQRVGRAAAAVVTGEWITPGAEDPFTVPLRDHAAVLFALKLAANRVKGAKTYDAGLEWTRETRVFASSEGSHTTQTLYALRPHVRTLGVFVNPSGTDGLFMDYPGLVARAGGFELVAETAAVQEDIKRWTEDVACIAALPRITLEVGRYPIVFSGRALGVALGTTLGRALELDRALGEEAEASGTSYLNPPVQLLGTMVANPKLTVTADRAMPSVSAVQWDDEGVVPQPCTLIAEGRLVDYHTSRAHAATLREWYEHQGRPVRSNGSVMIPDAADPIMIRAPRVSIVPSVSSTNVEALCKEVDHGLLVLDMGDCRTDQSLSSLYCWSGDGEKQVLEIVRGKPVRRVRHNAIDMAMKRLWKEQLVAIGDASTVEEHAFPVSKGIPWQTSLQATRAPAALFKDVNVTR